MMRTSFHENPTTFCGEPKISGCNFSSNKAVISMGYHVTGDHPVWFADSFIDADWFFNPEIFIFSFGASVDGFLTRVPTDLYSFLETRVFRCLLEEGPHNRKKLILESGLTFLRDRSHCLANYASVWNTNQRDSNWLVKIWPCNVQAAFIRTLKSPGHPKHCGLTNTAFQHISVTLDIKGRPSATGYIAESGSLICFLCPFQIELKKNTIAIKDAHLRVLPPPTRKNSMCRRQLRFTKSITCGHLTLTGENTVDCRSNECHLSTAHLEYCITPECRRYYERPERFITKEEPGICIQCLSRRL